MLKICLIIHNISRRQLSCAEAICGLTRGFASRHQSPPPLPHLRRFHMPSHIIVCYDAITNRGLTLDSCLVLFFAFAGEAGPIKSAEFQSYLLGSRAGCKVIALARLRY